MSDNLTVTVENAHTKDRLHSLEEFGTFLKVRKICRKDGL